MAEIKISELSIGDWVRVDDFDKVLIKRVSAIDGTRNQIGIIKNNRGGIYWYCNDEIEPIPLTPEILEKNGFVYSRVSRWYKCELKDTQRTTIGVHFGLIGADRIEISSVDAFDEDWNTIDVMINKPIKGVHQLQHALRLAGVEKEITL